jgi:hypothetical protein
MGVPVPAPVCANGRQSPGLVAKARGHHRHWQLCEVGRGCNECTEAQDVHSFASLAICWLWFMKRCDIDGISCRQLISTLAIRRNSEQYLVDLEQLATQLVLLS